MWEAEPWLPGVLSPALSPLLWLAGLAIAWLAAAAGGQPFRWRGVCWLVLGQSVVYAAAFSSSSIGSKGRFNPNDGFCVAGALAAAMALLALIVMVAHLLRARGADEPAPPPLTSAERKIRFGTISVILFVIVPTSAYTSFVATLDGDELASSRLAAAFITTALLSGVALSSGRLPIAYRKASELAGGLLLVAVAAGALPQFALSAEPLALTDAALIGRFRTGLDDGDEARATLAELKRRRSGRLSALSDTLHAMRATAGRDLRERDRLVEKARSQHGPWWAMQPFRASPEASLLAVAVARGELSEPKAWAADPNIPKEIRWGAQDALAGRPVKYDPERFQ